MAPSERAVKNHEKPFSNSFVLASPDPELIETFDNFAFDEVLRESKLDVKTRLMIQLAAIIACQAVNEYRVMLGAALNVGVTPIDPEVILKRAWGKSATAVPGSLSANRKLGILTGKRIETCYEPVARI
jgi:4-carboxymuconolactone decarboxylase